MTDGVIFQETNKEIQDQNIKERNKPIKFLRFVSRKKEE